MQQPLESIAYWSAAAPDRVALVSGGVRLTYGNLAQRIGALSASLSPRGVDTPLTAIVWCEDSTDAVIGMLSCWLVGATAVPLDPTRPLKEVAKAAQLTGAKCAIASKRSPLAALLRTFDRVELLGRGGTLTSEWINGPIPTSSTPTLFYTSGTVGVSKCVHWADNFLAEAVSEFCAVSGWDGSGVLASTLRPELIPTLLTTVLPTLMQGGRAVLLTPTTIGNMSRTLRREEVTSLLAVPSVWQVMFEFLRRSRFPLAEFTLHRTVSTSAALDRTLVEEFHDLTGCWLRSFYGLSEAGPVCYNDSDEPVVLANSVGRPLPGVSLSLLPHEDGSAAGYGELVVQRATRPAGYFNRPDLNSKVYAQDGIHTGDVATIDSKGYVYLSGRAGTRINRLGHMVSPEEVELVIRAYPGIVDAQVKGVLMPDGTEEIRAVLVTRVPVSISDLKHYCSEEMASYKVPQHVEFVDILNRNAMGKLRRPTS